jgi:GNAT superfamily N-acetyltransferase
MSDAGGRLRPSGAGAGEDGAGRGASMPEAGAGCGPGVDAGHDSERGGGARRAVLVVRAAGASDLEPLSFFFDTALRKDYFLKRGQLADIVRGAHHRVLVAELDAVLVGVAILTRGARLVNVLVHPSYRGLGIGSELIRASGAQEVRAKLDMSAGDPRGFYRALGFRGTGQFNGKGNIELMRAARGSRRRKGRST